MTDPTDNTITTSSTSSTYRTYDTNPSDTTYGTYEDSTSISDYGLRGDSDIRPYNAASEIRGYDPSDYAPSITEEAEQTAGKMYYDPVTGAYDEHMDYALPDSQRHHRARVSPGGTYQLREVERFDDGMANVHREYRNPNTGTSYIRDFQR